MKNRANLRSIVVVSRLRYISAPTATQLWLTRARALGTRTLQAPVATQ